MKIIKGSDVGEYLRLKAQGYVTLWVGNGLICMELRKLEGI